MRFLPVSSLDGESCHICGPKANANKSFVRRCPREKAGLVPRFINTTTFVASIFGSGEARRGSIPRSGAVTEEQRSQNRKATQPSGRRFFLAQTSLLTPYRPLKGMRVVRASSWAKNPSLQTWSDLWNGVLSLNKRRTKESNYP